MGWTLRGSNPGWGPRFPAPVQNDPGAHQSSCAMGSGSFPEVKRGRNLTLTSHPLLVPRSRKITAIPLLPLWAVRPVQSFSACTRVHFTLSFKFVSYYIWIHTETRVANVTSLFACNFTLRVRQMKRAAYKYVYLVISFGNISLLRHAFVHVRPLLCLSRSNCAM